MTPPSQAANVTHSLTSIVNPSSVHGSGEHFCIDASGYGSPDIISGLTHFPELC